MMCEYRNALVTDLFNKIREPSTFLDVRDPVKLVYDHNRILAAPSVRDFQQPMNHRVELTRRLLARLCFAFPFTRDLKARALEANLRNMGHR